ncbi:unnamed protein product [Phytophthora fragariaefolia]|uniref:Unnamed protein product n=1 Tax=Phytophthora fragariaefolia TaxID=1490495 RepID=A0A9W6XH20_9STRA|nr:unnamed protein product [Phytophthora fragariaefolia]
MNSADINTVPGAERYAGVEATPGQPSSPDATSSVPGPDANPTAPTASAPSAPPVPDMAQILANLVNMFTLQQQTMAASQQQMHAFMAQQARFQHEMFEMQARANCQKQKANPPKFNGRADEDLELWLFQIEEHFAAYSVEQNSNDSRFVDMVVPFLGSDVLSRYREFKFAMGENPRP